MKSGNDGDALWKGVPLRDLTKEQLIEAMFELNHYNESRLAGMRDMVVLAETPKRKSWLRKLFEAWE